MPGINFLSQEWNLALERTRCGELPQKLFKKTLKPDRNDFCLRCYTISFGTSKVIYGKGVSGDGWNSREKQRCCSIIFHYVATLWGMQWDLMLKTWIVVLGADTFCSKMRANLWAPTFHEGKKNSLRDSCVSTQDKKCKLVLKELEGNIKHTVSQSNWHNFTVDFLHTE